MNSYSITLPVQLIIRELYVKYCKLLLLNPTEKRDKYATVDRVAIKPFSSSRL